MTNHFPIQSRPGVALVAVVMLLLVAAPRVPAAPVGSPTVTLRQIDDKQLMGQWAGYEDGKIRVALPDSQTALVPLNDITSVAVQGHSRQARGNVTFYLKDSGLLVGELTGGFDDGIVANSVLGEALNLPFDSLAGMRFADSSDFPAAEKLFQDALADPLPGQDSLITRDADEPKHLRGRFVNVTPETSRFEFGGRSRSLQTEKIYGIVLALGAGERTPSQATIELTSGERIGATLLPTLDHTVRIRASFGAVIDIPIGSVAVIRIRSNRVTYLSSLTPDRIQTEGILHRPWPVKFDRSVSGGEIRMDAVPFATGVGVHSYTRLTYDIHRAYTQFVCTIGLDDMVRPMGSVVFRVLGDGRVLLDSGLLLGTDAAKNILVDVDGVDRLELEVDYGDAWDLAEYANWADARLIRPADHDRGRVEVQ